MADIGIRPEGSSLVLWHNRDFRWTFQNLDKVGRPVDFEPGRLFFELQTRGEHSAEQTITLNRADGGNYTLTGLGGTTANIPFDDEAPDLRAKLEALPGGGAGNVRVSGLYFPQWLLTVTFSGANAPTFPRNVQRAIDAAVRNALSTVETLLGGNFVLQSVYTPPTWTFTVTVRHGMTENDLLTYIVDILNTTVLNAIKNLPDVVDTGVSVHEFYAPKRVFTVQFQNSLSNQPIPALVPAYSGLTGSTPIVEVEVDEPGKHPLTIWDFVIDGSNASIKVESEEVNKVSQRTPWQLVFLPDGEESGGEGIDKGTVTIIQ